MSCSCSTNEDLLIELTLTRTNQEIRQTKDIYLKMYDRPLLMDVLDETGGNLRRFLTRVLLGTRDEGTAVDEPEAEKAAQVLFDASQNEPPSIFKFLLGVDPQADAFIDILTHANHCQIEKIDEFYTGLAGKSLRDEIAEMSMFRKTNLGSGEMNAKEEEAAANLQEAQHALDEALGTAQGVLEADEHCDVVEIGDDTAKSVEVRLVLDGLQNAENSPDIAEGTDAFVALEEAKVELSKAELNWTRAKSDLATARPARTRLFFFAAWSMRRALLTPQANPGSLCRCGKST